MRRHLRGGDHSFLAFRTAPTRRRGQLARHLASFGYTSSTIDVRDDLHSPSKERISYIGDKTLVVMEEMAENTQFQDFELIRVSAQESYAANCVR